MRDSDTTDNGRYKIMNTMTYDSSLIIFDVMLMALLVLGDACLRCHSFARYGG